MAKVKTAVLAVFLLVFGIGPAAHAWVIDFFLDKVMPTEVGNGGPARINLIGDLPELKDFTKVALYGPKGSLQAREIPGTDWTMAFNSYPDGFGHDLDVLSATFDLTGALSGKYDVQATYWNRSYFGDPQLESSYLFDALTVTENAKTSDLWVQLTGRTRVRVGATTEYSIYYGNSGNTPCPVAILYIAIPKGLDYELLFDPAPYQKVMPEALKTAAYGSGSHLQSEAEFDGSAYDFIPLFIRDVPPLSATPLKINVTWGNTPVESVLRVFWHGARSEGFDPLWGSAN